MARRYIPLQPAPPRNLSGAATDSEPSVYEGKRRACVAVACNNCRRRKKRCDGNRPSCQPCTSQNALCIYKSKQSSAENDGHTRGSNPSSSKIGDKALEVIELLSTMPLNQLDNILRLLNDTQHVSTLLALQNISTPLSIQRLATAEGNSSIEPSTFIPEPEPMPRSTPPNLNPINDIAPTNVRQELPQPGARKASGIASLSNSSPMQASACEQLKGLRISRWTSVQISDDLASRVILLYLSMEHTLLIPFDANLFIYTLVTMEGTYCTDLLVNALMYWACQMYINSNNEADDLVNAFCIQAEALWKREKARPTRLTVVAAQFISFGYLVQGRDHVVPNYLSDATQRAAELGLFEVDARTAYAVRATMIPGDTMTLDYPAWGAFNWVTLMGLFDHQPGVEYSDQLPTNIIPDGIPPRDSGMELSQSTTYTDLTFRAICGFWNIMHGLAVTRNKTGPADFSDYGTIFLAKHKFRELVEWASTLPPNQSQSNENSTDMLVFHLWFHAATLDIFRPFIGNGAQQFKLDGPLPLINTPDGVYVASLLQLKRLIIEYRFKCTSSVYSVLWYTAMLYTANGVLQSKDDANWLPSFLHDLYGEDSLQSACRVTEAIAKGMMYMLMRNGDILSQNARRALNNLLRNNRNLVWEDGHVTSVDGLDQTLLNHDTTTSMFEGTLMNSTTLCHINE